MSRLGAVRDGVILRSPPPPLVLRLVAALCAVCADDLSVGSVVRVAPLGRGNALVNVCEDCDTGEVRARDSERAYESPESKGNAAALIDAAYKRLGIRGVPADECLSPAAVPIDPGFVVCRVPRHVDGKPIDNNEAYSIARRRWGAEVAHVSTTARYHVFQRPGTGVAITLIAYRRWWVEGANDAVAPKELYLVPQVH